MLIGLLLASACQKPLSRPPLISSALPEKKVQINESNHANDVPVLNLEILDVNTESSAFSQVSEDRLSESIDQLMASSSQINLKISEIIQMQKAYS